MANVSADDIKQKENFRIFYTTLSFPSANQTRAHSRPASGSVIAFPVLFTSCCLDAKESFKYTE